MSASGKQGWVGRPPGGPQGTDRLTDHAMLQFDLVIIDSSAPDPYVAEHTVMVPLDEVESRLSREQVRALRGMSPFGACDRTGRLTLGANVALKPVVLTGEKKPSPRGGEAAMTRQARRRRAREDKRLSSAEAGVILSVAIATSDSLPDDVTSYDFRLSELEAQLTAEQLTLLRQLELVTATRQCQDVWVVFALLWSATDEAGGGGQAGAPRLHVVR